MFSWYLHDLVRLPLGYHDKYGSSNFEAALKKDFFLNRLKHAMHYIIKNIPNTEKGCPG